MDSILILLVGLVGLSVGTELIVRGAIDLADRYRLNDAFIGLGILSIGTDLPELAIALDASLFRTDDGQGAGIALGSAVGSSIGQISLVLGAVGLLGGFTMARKALYLYGAALCGAVFFLFAAAVNGTVSRIEGTLLILLYISFFIVLIRNRHSPDIARSPNLPKPTQKTWFLLIFGFILLLGNAELTVKAALALVDKFGVNETTVSVVILGLGSSLPELSLSGWALLRKKVGLSLGNLMGSNILDTLLVPGLAAMITPLAVASDTLWIDLPVLLAFTLLVLFFLRFHPLGLRRKEAIFLMVGYGLYVVIRFGEAVMI